MFLSREIDIKLCKNDTKKYICKILYKSYSINRSYSTNTQPIWKRGYTRGARNSGLLLFYLNLIILIDIIDNIIYTSGPCHQHSNQWQCSIVVTCLRTVSCDQYTALSLEGILVTWYGHIYYMYTFWYNFDTVLYQFLKTGTSHKCLLCIVQVLRFSGVSIYTPFIFPLQSL